MDSTGFYSGTERIASVIDMPDTVNGRIPCAILCHGYTSYRDEFGGFLKISNALCKNDIGVIRFDFRGCGESTGNFHKGRMLCGREWIEDVYNAFQYAYTLEWVDKDNIMLLGMSMGGAAVLSTLKYLRGVKMAIAISPVDNGYEWLKGLWVSNSGEAGWEAFLDEVHNHIMQRLLTGEDELTGVNKILPFSPEDYKLFVANTEQYPLSTANTTWSSAEDILYRVNASRELLSSKNDIPVLFIHGTGDTLVPCKGTQAMFEAYLYKKELLLLEGKPHGLLLEDDTSRLIGMIVDWIMCKEGEVI